MKDTFNIGGQRVFTLNIGVTIGYGFYGLNR
jgi:hypothetical protein